MSDLDATVAWAKARARPTPAKLGITGFCWGGRIVWLYAAHNPDLKAGVAWYGRLVGDKPTNAPAHPVDLAERDEGARSSASTAARTPASPSPPVEQMREALQGRRQARRDLLYPDTPHGFYADYRPPTAKQQGRGRLEAPHDWFKKHGVA